jgi:alpha-beta hydrolase superfamily lysophospholipase
LLLVLLIEEGYMDPIDCSKPLDMLDMTKNQADNRFLKAYKTCYGLDFANVQYHLGTIATGTHSIAVQTFQPDSDSRGTVIVVHGYFDHGGMTKNIIKTCIDLNYTVAAIDLPGHGLSSGERASIDSIVTYAKTLDIVMEQLALHLPSPFHFIGHSTGCAAALEWMYHEELVNSRLIDKIIFLSPLIRVRAAPFARFLLNILKMTVSSIPGTQIPNTSNPSFEQFRRSEPLRPQRVPVQWMNAVAVWCNQMIRRGLLDKKITVIQGDQDAVLDWRYNVDFIRRKVSESEIHIIPGAKHQLHNEKDELRDQVTEIMKNVLSDY